MNVVIHIVRVNPEVGHVVGSDLHCHVHVLVGVGDQLGLHELGDVEQDGQGQGGDHVGKNTDGGGVGHLQKPVVEGPERRDTE